MSLDGALEQGFLTTKLDALTNWARANAAWPMPMGLACCAIEMMAFAGPRYDASRFGSEGMRFSPRQSAGMIVAGWCAYKMAHAIRRIWERVPGPQWCIVKGASAAAGGMHLWYRVVTGV